LRLLAVPVNDFQNTAPQSSACEKSKLKAGVNAAKESSIQLLDKVHTNVPFLKWLQDQDGVRGGSSGFMDSSYEKFLVDSRGVLIRRYRAFDSDWEDVSGELGTLLR